jgi:hypothetical protein
MLKKLMIVGGLALSLAACATNPTTADAPKTADNTPPAGCVADTATRLPVTAHDCAAFGRSYTQKDLKATGAGAIDVGTGLRMLDPAVSTNGGL